MNTPIMNIPSAIREIEKEAVYTANFGDDISFGATVRTLLFDRAEVVNFNLTGFSVTRSRWHIAPWQDRELSPRDLLIDNPPGLRFNNLDIVSMRARGEAEALTGFTRTLVHEHFTEVFSDYTHLDAAETYLKQQGYDADVVINPNTRSTMIFLSGLSRNSYKMLHTIESMFSILCPWLFENKPLNAFELELMLSLREETSEHYEALINEFVGSKDIIRLSIERKLKGFTNQFLIAELNAKRSELNGVELRIEDYENQVARDYAKAAELRLLVSDLQLKQESNDAEGDKELTDIFCTNKALRLIERYNSSLEFEVSTYLSNYDIDMFEAYVKNERSVLYDVASYGDFKLEEGLALLKAIFIEERFKVKMAARFFLDFSRPNNNPAPSYSDNNSEAINNPHLYYYSCLGDYEPAIKHACRDKDYAMALNLCIASTGSLNVAEGINMRNFIRDLFTSNRKVIVLEDGAELYVAEAVELLKERKEVENE